ncbi:hypothetical protein PRZ48_006651 [Zasmidium cellare]|uniref:Uncharacterized protein n=1 Tax=Zasmidium cellare TaxID=395010 RepID=A0ABR0EPU9_ZASCE|nr:hypothetical protein PRZ48_006651 [Zasmidium cellare]
MFQLQQYIPPHLTFAWLGAFCGFVAFQHCIGNALAKKIYMSFGEEKGLGTVSSPRIAGAGLALNYVLQLLVSVLIGGYTMGTAEARTGGSQPAADGKPGINERQQGHHSDDGDHLAVEQGLRRLAMVE